MRCLRHRKATEDLTTLLHSDWLLVADASRDDEYYALARSVFNSFESLRILTQNDVAEEVTRMFVNLSRKASSKSRRSEQRIATPVGQPPAAVDQFYTPPTPNRHIDFSSED